MVQKKEIQIPCVGYSVAADLYEGSHENVVLILIGFTSNRDRYAEMAAIINRETGDSVLVLEYSGHGKSEFNIEEIMPAQNFLESITAFDWIADNFQGSNIKVIGGSYGGLMATQLTKYRAFSKLLLIVPAIYKPEDFYTKWSDYNREVRHEYRRKEKDLVNHPLLKRARNFKGSTLVVTHELDTICPPNSTKAFIDAFQAETWEAKGFQHATKDSNLTEEQTKNYYNKIAEWLK